MSDQKKSQVVYIVTCYGNIQGVYAKSEDAFKAQMDMINKNRAAELLARPVIESFNF